MFALRRSTTRCVALLQVAAALSRGRRRRPSGPRLPPKVLRRPEGGVPAVARCHPELYDELLKEKVAKLEASLRSATSYAPLPTIEVHESQREHFRMRAAFQVWHVGDEPDCSRHLVMYEHGNRDPHEIDRFPMGSRKINELMPIVREAIQPAVLGRKIIDVRFLTTQTDDALIALAYNRDLKGCKEFSTEEWQDAARDLHQKTGATIVGRSRKFKVVVGSEDDTVTEVLKVHGNELTYAQQEGAFTQPNAGVCEKMLMWAHDATLNSEGDLCELYCGGGTFTVRIGRCFGLLELAHVMAGVVWVEAKADAPLPPRSALLSCGSLPRARFPPRRGSARRPSRHRSGVPGTLSGGPAHPTAPTAPARR